MPLIRKLTDELGGKIKVMSTKGRGSYFLVQMPASKSSLSAECEFEESGSDESRHYEPTEVTNPAPLFDPAEINIDDLEELKKLAKLGQLSLITAWIQWIKKKDLSQSCGKFIGRIEAACDDVDLDKIVFIVTQALASKR
jgi:hypothetical protein